MPKAYFTQQERLTPGIGGTKEEGWGNSRSQNGRERVLQIVIAAQVPEQLLENSLKSGN